MQSTCWIYISICGDLLNPPRYHLEMNSVLSPSSEEQLKAEFSNLPMIIQQVLDLGFEFRIFEVFKLSNSSWHKETKKMYYEISLTFRMKERDVPIIILMRQVPHRTRYLNTWLPVLDRKDGKSWSLRDNLKGLFFLCVVCMWYYLSMFLLQPLAAPSLQPLLQAFLQEP